MNTVNRRIRGLWVIITIIASPVFLSAQPFTEVLSISDSLTHVWKSAVSWGDFDNDEDLDILLTGSGIGGLVSTVYRNDSGTFTDIQAGLIGVQYGSVAWGDYDNDQDLDIALAGDAGSDSIAKVYRNDGGVFVDINAPFIGVANAAIAWGDFDNDGDLDVLVAGATVGVSSVSKIYRNEGGVFVDVNAGLIGLAGAAVAWGDYDNDGDLDILIAGQQFMTLIALVYRNDGGHFVNIVANLPPVAVASVAWGDYDNDGDLDILIAGETSSSQLCQVYRNDGGVFTNINAGLPGFGWGTVGWGDFDNDGDLDILLGGQQSGVGRISRIYRNDGGLFSDISAGLIGIHKGSAAWGDYDSDGDLDILITGLKNMYTISTVYRNDNPFPNIAPIPASNLAAIPLGDTAIHFTWHPAVDDSTPSLGLSYRLWIGTATDSFNLSSSLADTTSGWRRIAAIGNIQDTSWTLRNVVIGKTYFACVSAIDAGLMGSPCSNKTSIMVLVSKNETKPWAVIAGPNPTSGRINITSLQNQTEEITYSLTNLAGQTIQGISGFFWKNIELDISMLPQGTYLLRLESPGLLEAESLKIIKE